MYYFNDVQWYCFVLLYVVQRTAQSSVERLTSDRMIAGSVPALPAHVAEASLGTESVCFGE